MDKKLHKILNKNCSTPVFKERVEAVENAFKGFSENPNVESYFGLFVALLDCFANGIVNAKLIIKFAGAYGEYVGSKGNQEKILKFFSDPDFEEKILSHDDRIIYGYLYLSVGYAFLSGLKYYSRHPLAYLFFGVTKEIKLSKKAYANRMKFDVEFQKQIREEQIASNNAYLSTRRY